MKIFQVCLITFVAVFSLLTLLFILSGLASILAPLTQTEGISSVAGGFSTRLLNILGAFVTMVVVLAVLLVVALRTKK